MLSFVKAEGAGEEVGSQNETDERDGDVVLSLICVGVGDLAWQARR